MKVEIYCYRGPNYYGFGLTPEAAVAQAVQAGMRRDKLYQNYMMTRLPEGVNNVYVDDFGGLNWDFPKEMATIDMESITSRPGARLYLNSNTDKWQEEEIAYHKPKGEPQLLHVRIEGWIERPFAAHEASGTSGEEFMMEWAETVDAPRLAQELYENGDYEIFLTPLSKYKAGR